MSDPDTNARIAVDKALLDIGEIAPGEFEMSIRAVLPQKLRQFNCNYQDSYDHGHTDCLFFVFAAREIERLRELIRRALADGMGVLDEPDYDLYSELSTYLTGVTPRILPEHPGGEA